MCALTGCGPVAIGQTLRYYRVPENDYDWDEMAYGYATQETAKLLKDIGNDINAQYGLESTSTLFSDECSYLSKYFSTSVYNYNFDKVFEHVGTKNIAYMRADLTDTKNQTGGHAFICTGGSRRTSVTYYSLYTFSGRYTYAKVCGPLCENQQKEGYVYLNWGWNGSYNGMYVYNDFSIDGLYTNVKNIKVAYLKIK